MAFNSETISPKDIKLPPMYTFISLGAANGTFLS